MAGVTTRVRSGPDAHDLRATSAGTLRVRLARRVHFGASAVRSMEAVLGPCGGCGKAIRASAVLYTEQARPVCAMCFTKADVRARRRPLFEGWSTALIGAIATAIPVVVRAVAALMVAAPGAIAHDVRGWVEVASGAVAAICGATTIGAARSRASAGWLVIGALIALVGAYHVVHGAGLAW